MDNKVQIIIPQNALDAIISLNEQIGELNKSNQEILKTLRAIELIERPRYFTKDEFMKYAKIGATTFQNLMAAGMQFKKLGPKIYVPAGELERYFNGEFAK